MKKSLLLLALLMACAGPAMAIFFTVPKPTGAPPAPSSAPGLYVQVLDGTVSVANGAGTTTFSTGQFGFTPNTTQPPVLIPASAGNPFIPPPAFNSTTSTTGQSGSTPAKSNDVDCVVR
ncbi:MAG: hypothetical protein EOO26_11495 [Comamonadaceae bacterium]|nr:MAG: hypothetical protein EOO26_11495 [Comamonadaceae bacterium]